MDMKNLTGGTFDMGTRVTEEFLYVFHRSAELPILLDCAGITYPSPDYYVRRSGAAHYVFEQILEGEGTLIYNGIEHRLHAGDFYCLEPDTEQYYASDPLNPMKKIWVNCYCEMFRPVCTEFGIHHIGYFPNFDATQEMFELYAMIKSTPDNDVIAYHALEILFSLLSRLSRRAHETIRSEQASEIARRTMRLIHISAAKKIDLDEISRSLYKSKSQITRDFIKYYGISPYRYLLERKLELAKNLLVKTDAKVKEIAETLCFTDEHYFSTLFKQKIGITPLAFRAANRR